MEPKYLASSHAGRFSYWLFADHYVYQLENASKKWHGWICAESVWERTFSKLDWVLAAQEAA